MNQMGDELHPRMRGAFDQLKQIAPRDPQAAARGRRQFLARADALADEAVRRADARARGIWTWFPRRVLFATATAIALILILALSGAGMTVYAAQDSLPDAPLYSVKLITEDAQVSLASRPEDKLALYLAFADRRVGEIAKLDARQVAPPDIVVDRLQQELGAAVEIAADMSGDGQSQTLARMQATIQRQQQTLARVADSAPEPAKPVLSRVNSALAEHLTLVEMGLADPPRLKREMHGAGNRETPPGQERRATSVPPGQEQRQGAPGQERRVSPTAARAGQYPSASPTPKNPGAGKGNDNGRKP